MNQISKSAFSIPPILSELLHEGISLPVFFFYQDFVDMCFNPDLKTCHKSSIGLGYGLLLFESQSNSLNTVVQKVMSYLVENPMLFIILYQGLFIEIEPLLY